MTSSPKIFEKRPNFREIEERWQRYWDGIGIYRFNPKSGKPIYSIDTPPPTVSGDLHVGHAFSYNQAEFIARQRRMQGFEVFYPMGFDDNGLPTERYVEKIRGVSTKSMEREEFIRLCLEETEKARERYRDVWKRLGISVDWDYAYSTIDEASRRAAQRSFIRLYKDGKIYRKKDAIIWCTTCETGISQADVNSREEDTTLNYIYFSMPYGKRLMVATSRPEFLPACQAVFVHPDDERYHGLIGEFAEDPLLNKPVKVMPDSRVDPKFGTGAVMVCTFGDNTDVEWWREHNLPLTAIIDERGYFTREAGPYEGATVKQAREKILENLSGRGLLNRQEPLHHEIGVHERCDTPIEYRVADQWFIRLLGSQDKFLEQGDKINWVPASMKNRYMQDVRNLKWDWNISRQRTYGVPFPVWYCESCNEVKLPDENELPIDTSTNRPKDPCSCGSDNFVPESDVMDTWMTSSLTPLINAHWEEPDSRIAIYPMDLRPQAHDIIRTWAFYTIVKSLYHTGDIPWRNAMISSYVLDSKGRGMSKHLGNTVLPLDIVERYSADALRLWAAEKPLGRNVLFKEEEVVEGNNFLVKIWNAARLIAPHLKDYDGTAQDSDLRIPDRWIRARFNNLVRDVTQYFDSYEYFRAASDTKQFFWGSFCDFFLEMVKHRLYDETIDSRSRRSAQKTLYEVFLGELKLLAPFVPHITEELYHGMFRERDGERSIHTTQWPTYRDEWADAEALELGDLSTEAISEIRRWKTINHLRMGQEIDELTFFHPKAERLELVKDDIAGTIKVKNMRLRNGEIKIVT